MSESEQRAQERGQKGAQVAELVVRAADRLAGLDRLVHEPARLAILAILMMIDETDFVFVQKRAGLTAGNLATHLARLEEAGFVRVTKTFEDRRPRTLLALTEPGRTALTAWRRTIGNLLDLLP